VGESRGGEKGSYNYYLTEREKSIFLNIPGKKRGKCSLHLPHIGKGGWSLTLRLLKEAIQWSGRGKKHPFVQRGEKTNVFTASLASIIARSHPKRRGTPFWLVRAERGDVRLLRGEGKKAFYPRGNLSGTKEISAIMGEGKNRPLLQVPKKGP